MNKQDYVELKAEVQKTMLSELFKTKKKLVNYERDIFNYAFDRAYALGKTYCAEAEAEEEMLCVSRKRVLEIYSYNEDILSLDPTHSGANLLKKKFQELFGSKCLPDEKTQPVEAEETCTDDCLSQCSSQDSDRLHIAAQILAGLYANESYARHRCMDQLVKTALKATDMLIAKSGKGGSDGE